MLKYATVAGSAPQIACASNSDGFPANMRIGGTVMPRFTEDDRGIFFSLQYKNANSPAAGDIISKQ